MAVTNTVTCTLPPKKNPVLTDKTYIRDYNKFLSALYACVLLKDGAGCSLDCLQAWVVNAWAMNSGDASTLPWSIFQASYDNRNLNNLNVRTPCDWLLPIPKTACLGAYYVGMDVFGLSPSVPYTENNHYSVDKNNNTLTYGQTPVEVGGAAVTLSEDGVMSIAKQGGMLFARIRLPSNDLGTSFSTMGMDGNMYSISQRSVAIDASEDTGVRFKISAQGQLLFQMQNTRLASLLSTPIQTPMEYEEVFFLSMTSTTETSYVQNLLDEDTAIAFIGGKALFMAAGRGFDLLNESTFTDFCSQNPQYPACNCLARNNFIGGNPLLAPRAFYREFLQGASDQANPYATECFYTPCQQNFHALTLRNFLQGNITSSFPFVKQDYNTVANCPRMTCINAVDKLNGDGTVDTLTNNVHQSLSCPNGKGMDAMGGFVPTTSVTGADVSSGTCFLCKTVFNTDGNINYKTSPPPCTYPGAKPFTDPSFQQCTNITHDNIPPPPRSGSNTNHGGGNSGGTANDNSKGGLELFVLMALLAVLTLMGFLLPTIIRYFTAPQ